jgi:hypothetical protein
MPVSYSQARVISAILPMALNVILLAKIETLRNRMAALEGSSDPNKGTTQ